MDNTNHEWSCLNCIWHDQCESDIPCDMFDDGKSLTDEEIDIQIKLNRKKYGDEYLTYISEYDDD